MSQKVLPRLPRPSTEGRMKRPLKKFFVRNSIDKWFSGMYIARRNRGDFERRRCFG